MKKYFIFLILMGAMFSTPLSAQNKGFGLGIMLGEPTGLSAKAWTSPINAIDFGLGVGLGGDRIKYKGVYDNGSRVHFHMDYLWHSFRAIGSTGRVPLYYGIGARFNSGGGYDESLGIRGVIGFEWFPDNTTLDIFFEAVPVFQVTPLTGLGMDAAVGIRYFFE